MKKLFLTLSFFLTFNAFALEAIVIVLEAPLLKEARMNSTVLQTLRKGARVYVPDKLKQLSLMPEFIQTFDRAGNVAFVPTKYIKIITHDLSESNMPITFPKNDPTDYRLEEPIPSTYPFDNTSFLRGSVAFSLGNNALSPFEYSSRYKQQSYSPESGARFSMSRKVKSDKFDRYYVGFLTTITTSNNKIQFQNTTESRENRSIIKIGPIVTFDAYKSVDYRLTIGSGLTANYHRSTLTMKGDAGEEQRLFSGFSLSPLANTTAQMMDVFPNTDLIAGADLSLFLPYTQKTKDDISIQELWGNQPPSEIKSGFKPQVSFFLGFQAKY